LRACKKAEMDKIRFAWHNIERVGPTVFVCGYCGAKVAGSEGFFAATNDIQNLQARVYVCPNCTFASFFIGAVTPNSPELTVKLQKPAPSYGADVASLPEDVAATYDEARRSISAGACDGAVMLCRKLLMHVAVERGDGEGKTFEAYVDFLVANGYVAPTNKGWVSKIRTIGNEANHKLVNRTEVEAKTLLEFAEMLLKTVDECPARASKT